ncbi:MAG: hypothetical protein WB763_16790 [Terriglobia bacterium]|jgi:hypothetical protein
MWWKELPKPFAVSVNPDTLPSLSLNQPEYRQFCKKRLAMAIEQGFTTIRIRYWLAFPKLEIVKADSERHRSA